MDQAGYAYGTTIAVIILSAIAAMGSIGQYLRTFQFPLRYAFIFLASSCLLIPRSILLGLAQSPTILYNSEALVSAIGALTWFSRMFIPLFSCVFFTVCHMMVSNSNDNGEQPPQSDAAGSEQGMTTEKPLQEKQQRKTFSQMLLFPTYFAYFLTFVFVITNAVTIGVTMNMLTKGGDTMVLARLTQLDYFNVYGVWIFVICAILQLWLGRSQLHRKAVISSSIYITIIFIAAIGVTITQVIGQSTGSGTSFNIVYFFMTEFMGALGLIYACLWCSTRYWVPDLPIS